MKIVYILPQVAQKAGTERVFVDKMNYLAETVGYEVTLLTYEQGQHPVAFPLSPNVRHIDLNVRFFPLYKYNLLKRIFLTWKRGKKLQRRYNLFMEYYKPDIVIATTYHIREIQLIMRCPFKVSSVLESHIDKRFLEHDARDRWLHSIYSHYEMRKMNRIVSKVDLIVALNEEDAVEWEKVGAKTTVITNMAHLNVSGLYCNTQSKRVIYAGRYCKQKGVRDLFRIWQMVYPQHKDWHLYCYGTGEFELKQTAEVLDMNIHVEEPTNDVFSRYREASVFVLCSVFEPFGLVLPEAMSCGLPIVAFDCPYGPAKIIADGDDGFLVRNRDLKEFADKLSALMDDEQLRLRMGKRAIQSSQRYAPEHIMPHWKMLFEKLCAIQ